MELRGVAMPRASGWGLRGMGDALDQRNAIALDVPDNSDEAPRLWGVIQKHITHKKGYAMCKEFANAMLSFLGEKILRRWGIFRDSVTDNFSRHLSQRFSGRDVKRV